MSTEFLHLLKGLRLEMTEVCGAGVVQRCQTPRGGGFFSDPLIFSHRFMMSFHQGFAALWKLPDWAGLSSGRFWL